MRFGLKIDGRPSEDLVRLARLAEDAGFAELWVCEDLGFAGGIAQAAVALAATDRIRVGLGIAPAAVRNPMYLAMEFGSLARMFPDRFLPGIGHGVPEWLEQVGQRPRSLMTCLEEVTRATQRLLSGEEVSCEGSHVRLDKVRLTHPPEVEPTISLGVRGPKGLALAASLRSGLIVAEGSTPHYVTATRRVVGEDADVTVFVWSHLSVDDGGLAMNEIAPTIQNALTNPHLTSQLGPWFGSQPDVDKTNQLAVVGDVGNCVAAVTRFAEAGADSLIFQPIRGTEEQQIALAGEHFIPAFGRASEPTHGR
jgi:5,10-methylenetetrahydromethanopterin reductase